VAKNWLIRIVSRAKSYELTRENFRVESVCLGVKFYPLLLINEKGLNAKPCDWGLGFGRG
jgi:hypothetical protein